MVSCVAGSTCDWIRKPRSTPGLKPGAQRQRLERRQDRQTQRTARFGLATGQTYPSAIPARFRLPAGENDKRLAGPAGAHSTFPLPSSDLEAGGNGCSFRRWQQPQEPLQQQGWLIGWEMTSGVWSLAQATGRLLGKQTAEAANAKIVTIVTIFACADWKRPGLIASTLRLMFAEALCCVKSKRSRYISTSPRPARFRRPRRFSCQN
jgi:hypothetical protein